MNKPQLSHNFQKAIGIEECAHKLRKANGKRLGETQGYDFPPLSVDVKQRDTETYEFRLAGGSRFQIYNSMIIQVQATGYLYKIDEDNTQVSYDTKVLWGIALFVYGVAIIAWILIFSGSSPFITLLGIVLGVARIIWEGIYARTLLNDLPFLLELISAS